MRGSGGACGGGGPATQPDGRSPTYAKSPTPLSPAPALANFRVPAGAMPCGATPSLSPQSQGVLCGLQRSPTLLENYRQRSPTTMLHWESQRVAGGLSRPQGEGRRSPLTGPYMPPPPMRATGGGVGRRNIFDDDANAETGSAMPLSPALANPNLTVSGSMSPLSEARLGYPAYSHHRAASTAALQHPPVGSRMCAAPGVSSQARDERGLRQRAASSISLVRPIRAKIVFGNNCGAIVDERDACSGSLLAQYRCGAMLGTGGFAEVYEFTELSTKQSYACKIIDKEKIGSWGEKRVRAEVEIHRRMHHPNILRLYKMFADDYYFFILLELCSNKNLMEVTNVRKVLPVAEVQHIMRQLTSAVNYIHGKRIIHRDIKLGNIMIDFSGNVKIGDFGFATEMMNPEERKTRLCGTPNYIAPEILQCSEAEGGYSFEVDIWSLGVVLFILSFGSPPFESVNVNTTYERIRRISYRFPSPEKASGSAEGGGASRDHEPVPECCKALIRSMLQRDPAARPTPQEVLDSAFLSPARSGSGKVGALLASLPHSPDGRVGDACRAEHGAASPHAQRGHWGSLVVASPIQLRSPINLPSPHAAHTPSSGRPGRQAPLNPLQERHGSSPRHGDTGDGEVRKALHEFSPEQDPSSGTATTATSERVDVEADEVLAAGSAAHRGGGGRLAVRPTGSGDDPRVPQGRAPLSNAHAHPHGAPRSHELPEPPAVFFRNAVYASKYGHGFTLSSLTGRDRLAMLFNDRTELIYEDKLDFALYRTRVRCQPTASELLPDGGLTEEGVTPAARTVVEEWRYFPAASVSMRPDPSGGAAGSGGGVIFYTTPVQKKFAISTFLSPYLSGKSSDMMFPTTRSTLKHLHKESCRRSLFRASADGDEGGSARFDVAGTCEGDESAAPDGLRVRRPAMATSVSLRDAVTMSAAELDANYAGLDMSLTAARFLNETYQISLMCTPPYPITLVPMGESPVVTRESRWKFDVLIYPPFRAVFGIETEHSRLHESFRDIRKDVYTMENGRLFFAAGSTSATHRRFMIPVELLRILCNLLRAVKAPTEVLDCFHC